MKAATQLVGGPGGSPHDGAASHVSVETGLEAHERGDAGDGAGVEDQWEGADTLLPSGGAGELEGAVGHDVDVADPAVEFIEAGASGDDGDGADDGVDGDVDDEAQPLPRA